MMPDHFLMKKPAINKEKAKDILKPSKRAIKKRDALPVEARETMPAVVTPEVQIKQVAVEDIPKRRPIQIGRGIGVCLCLLALLYALMLISYSPLDPSFTHAAPQIQPTNWIGKVGAWTSDIALFTLGWSAYWLVAVLLVSGYRMVSRTYHKTPFGRLWHLFGLALLLCGSTSIESLRLAYLSEPLPGEAGGVLGTSLINVTVPLIGALGMTIIMTVMTLWGAAVYFGFSWLDVCERVGAWFDRIFRRISQHREAKMDRQLGAQEQEKRSQDLKQDLSAQAASESTGDTENEDPFPVNPSAKPKVAINPQAKVRQSAVALEAKQERLFEEDSQPVRLSLRLFDPTGNTDPSIDKASLAIMSTLIENKLRTYGVEVKVRAANPGPVVTRYEIELAEGVKSASVKSLEADLARVLSVQSVRVLDTIPNTSYMGIEVPNPRRQIVKISELLGSQDFQKSRAALPLSLGKKITGEPFVVDLAKMPHLLVAGTTGSGKSVGVNSMILSLLYKFEPSQLRLILIDPKRVEFAYYEDIPHLLCPVVDQMQEAKHALVWCVKEMERRYKLAHSIKVRNIESYNEKVREAKANGEPLKNALAANAGEDVELEELPYIVVVVDELADLLMVDKKGVEESLIRLAQKARAAGIHLILATQRPSADVLSGLLRTNIPSRVAFQVATGSDSRIILDQTGAETLLGAGDFLFKMPSMQAVERVQAAFVTDEELERVTHALRAMDTPKYIDDVLVSDDEAESAATDAPRGNAGKKDPLFDKAVQIIVESNKCSVTFLQRRLGVGYPRAANIVDQLEAEGIVSPADSSGRRTINARNNEELTA